MSPGRYAQPTPNNQTVTASDIPSKSAEFRELYRVVQQLDSRVSELEKSNASLVDSNERLEDQIQDVHQISGKLSGDMAELADRVENLTEFESLLTELSEEDEELRESISEVLTFTQENRRHAEHRISKVIQRVAALEDFLATEENMGDPDTIQLVADGACELEHLAAIPEEIRDVKIDRKPLTRAVVVWEHFDEWATYSPHGYIVKSGDLRKHLQTALEEPIAWSPLYRVMAMFKQSTGDDYEFIDANTTGKALIKLHEGVSLPESDLVDAGEL
jgi:hypothetical protein